MLGEEVEVEAEIFMTDAATLGEQRGGELDGCCVGEPARRLPELGVVSCEHCVC